MDNVFPANDSWFGSDNKPNGAFIYNLKLDV